MSWDQIDESIRCLARWRRVQEHVQNLHIQRPPDAELITFETPIIDGDVLLLPNGPLRERDSEVDEHLSVIRCGDYYTLQRRHRERGEYYKGPVKLFSNFPLAGKFILTRYAAEFRHPLDLPIVLKPWIGAEPRTGWSTRDVRPTRERGCDHRVRAFEQPWHLLFRPSARGRLHLSARYDLPRPHRVGHGGRSPTGMTSAGNADIAEPACVRPMRTATR